MVYIVLDYTKVTQMHDSRQFLLIHGVTFASTGFELDAVVCEMCSLGFYD